MIVDYRLEPDLAPAEFSDVMIRSTLAERRPVDQPDVIAAMLTNADIVLTARVEGRLVGIARADQRLCLLHVSIGIPTSG